MNQAPVPATRGSKERGREPQPALASVMQGDHGLTLLTGGVEFFPALAAAIDAAEREVMLETYIFDFSRSPLSVAEALARAAERGVTVRVVMDGIGTGEVPAAWQQRWGEAGVRWRIFNPADGWRVLAPRGWRRLHRKLAVVDQQVAFCGGINLLDDYHDPNHGDLVEPRLDFSVRASGPLVADVHDTMNRLWWRLQVARKARQLDMEATVKAVRSAAEAGLDAVRGDGEAADTDEPGGSQRRPAHRRNPQAFAALVLRDNVRYRRRIETAYRLAINQAQREIIIANAYFIPGVTLQRALLRAAERGVRVTVLLQGRYEYFMAYHASRAVYDTLLKAGIRVVEYDASFLHAKVAVMDGPLGDVSTVGSSNLDPLSLLLAREANVFVRDDAFAAALRRQLQRAIDLQGRVVDPLSHELRPWRSRVLNWLAYAMMRIALLVNGKRY
jgi:cardiolipin synthase A/B